MIFSFGPFELDEGRFELRRDGGSVELQPKVLGLLLYLVQHRDRVVSKQELLEALWPGAVVTESSLTRAMSLARQAIDDRGQERAAIRTVSRRGYRFCVPLDESANREVAAHPAAPRAKGASASSYVGRADLVAQLTAAVEGGLSGRGTVLLLVGEPGIGKTRTAQLLAEHAAGQGARLARSWGIEDAAPTLWPWIQVLTGLLEERPEHELPTLFAGPAVEVARLLPGFHSWAGERSRVASARDEAARLRLFDGVRGLLERLAAEQPLLIQLDDLHWVDAESVWMLEYVTHAIGTTPLVIVATYREDDVLRDSRRALALEKLLRQRSAERWPLVGLSLDETQLFIESRTGLAPGVGLVDVLSRTTTGNPFFLDQVLRYLTARDLLGEERDAATWEALVPQGVLHLVEQRLHPLGEPTRVLLECAACIGSKFDVDLLSRSLGCKPADIASSLAEAIAAGLCVGGIPPVGRLRFSHGLVRDAVYARLAAREDARRAFHHHISDALEASAIPASVDLLFERAHHACRAAPLGDLGRAVDLARRAGERAASLHDHAAAAVWYRRALEVGPFENAPDSVDHVQLLLALGAAELRANGLQHARPIFRSAAEIARRLGQAELTGRAALAYAHRPDTVGHGDPHVIELLEAALAGLADPTSTIRIRISSRLGVELRYERPRDRAVRLVDAAVEAARRCGDAGTLAQALDDRSFVAFSPDDPHGWIDLNSEIAEVASEAGDLELVLAGRKGEVTGALEIGDLDAVDRGIEACARVADDLRTPYAQWFVHALRAMRDILEGRFEEAERRITAALSHGEQTEHEDVLVQVGAQLVHLRLEQGRAAEIEGGVRDMVRRFPEAPAWRAALARVELALGREGEARAELARLAENRFEDVPVDRSRLLTLALASEACHGLRDAARAETLEILLRPYAALFVVVGSAVLCYGAVSHHLGLLNAVRGRPDEALADLDRALGGHECLRAAPWLARTQLAKAEVLWARGRRGDRALAEKLLDAVSASARRVGLQPLLSAVERVHSGPHRLQ